MLLLPLITSQVSKFNLFPFIRQCACCSIIIIIMMIFFGENVSKSFTLLFVSTHAHTHTFIVYSQCLLLTPGYGICVEDLEASIAARSGICGRCCRCCCRKFNSSWLWKIIQAIMCQFEREFILRNKTFLTAKYS